MTLDELFRKYLDDNMTADELRRFREAAADTANRAELDRLIVKWINRDFPFAHPEEIDIETLFPAAAVNRGAEEVAAGEVAAGSGGASVPSGRRVIFFSGAAAAACLLLATGLFLLRRPSVPPVQMAAARGNSTPVIIPAGNKAVLTLADGTHIVLDSAADGRLASQGNTQIVKIAGGQVAYKTGEPGIPAHGQAAAGAARDPLLYNEIVTPRGGYYQLILPDGSAVWLDAASSLRYPTAFTGKDRSVELTGEAYFNIAPNKDQPFLITTRGVTVQVLGTEFNLMAYTDEDAIRTTLVSGSVQVLRGSERQQIRPGQQASWSNGGSAWQLSTPDMREVLAWKQGEFRFQGLPIAAIMRQIARWYDVDIEFRGPQPANEFSGVISRKKSVTELLTVLEETDEVHFTLKGRTIIVEAGKRS